MATEPGVAARCDDAYAEGDSTRSWFQAAPLRSGLIQPFTWVVLRRVR